MASSRWARTIAPRRATRAPASRRATTRRTNGSTCPRAGGRRWAARPRRPGPIRARRRDTGRTSAAMAAQGAPAVGIGLRTPHYEQVLERRPDLAFLEVHSENFFGDGGAPLAWLERFRGAYPLSLHGVGLSLGSADTLQERPLAKLEAPVHPFEPLLVSAALTWS